MGLGNLLNLQWYIDQSRWSMAWYSTKVEAKIDQSREKYTIVEVKCTMVEVCKREIGFQTECNCKGDS